MPTSSRSLLASQATLKKAVSFSGVGVHSGQPVNLRLKPALPNTGYIFLRKLPNGQEIEIPARWDSVSTTDLCTVIGDDMLSGVSTIEHLMAALQCSAIDNVVIEIDGPEVPIADGSSLPFLQLIEKAGVQRQAARKRFIRVLKPVQVERGASQAILRPSDKFRLDITIDFDQQVVGRQQLVLDVTETSFARELSSARTFGFMEDVAKLTAIGFARGASMENTVVMNETAVLNPEGLRFADECVRHKALDAVGDLALAGAPILGHYKAYRPGHKLNYLMLKALFADETAWELTDGLPSREQGKGEAAVAQAAAFAPVV